MDVTVHQRLLPLVLGLLLAGVILAGCMGTPSPDGSDGAGGDGGEEDGAPDEEDPSALPAAGALVPKEVISGVERVPEEILEGGGVLGYVFDEDGRGLIEGVSVVVQCHLEGLELFGPVEVLTTDEAGRFGVGSVGSFLDCERVSYQAVKAGYEQAVPVESDPLERGEQYLAFIALRPLH